MLEQLLQLITYEKLILFIKEKSLTFQSLNSEFTQKEPCSKASPVRLHNNLLKMNDSEILKQILPLEISEQMFSKGNLTLLAFVFALRHKVTILNILFNITSILCKKQDINLEELNKQLNFRIADVYYEHASILHPDFWNHAAQDLHEKKLPIIGFSAVGCLFSLRNIDSCRAFDHYDIIYCANKALSFFCATHERELFWQNNFAKESSTQAKMFRFYLDKNNFKEFDEASLQQLLNNFFHKYANYKNNFFKNMKSPPLDQTKILLEFYGFLNLEELRQLGLEELRKRFLEKAKLLHPDVGGSQDLFREARNKYEQLRELF